LILHFKFMPITTRKIVPATLRQQIVQEIRQAILTRSLVPGERLVERELSERLGTSLAATREALIQLEMEGLITKTPNSATHVTKLTLHEVENLFAVRRLLERHAFAEAAQIASKEAIQQIEHLHDCAIEIARSGNGVEYIDADLKWHQAVWRATRNNCLAETLWRLTLPLFGFSAIEVATRQEFDLEHDARTHEPLLVAIRNHDPGEVCAAFDRIFEIWRSQSLKGHERDQMKVSA
jgi:DNA-binding GntR family transcriptional regulator